MCVRDQWQKQQHLGCLPKSYWTRICIDIGLRSKVWGTFTHLTLLLLSRSVVSDFLQPHGLQRPRLPCPSPSPRVCSDSCPFEKSWLLFWSHLTTTTHKWKSSSMIGWVSSPGPSNPHPCTQAPIGIHFLMTLGRLKPCRRFDKLKEEWK